MLRAIAICGLALSLAHPVVADTPPRVVTTIGKLADITTRIGGDCVQVQSLIGAGADPHLYRPSAGDVQTLAQAQAIVFVDPALEARLADVLARLGATRPTLGVMQAALRPDLIRSANGAPDPHIWMDVALWAQIIDPIFGLLEQVAPDCTDQMQGNADVLRAQLATLDMWVRDAITSIPEGRRVLVTAHDAFTYFSAAYGIEASEAIEGISTESEAAIADIRAVADFVRERGVVAVFPETTINPRTIEALVREVQAQGGTLTLGASLFSDAMGDPGTAEGTYIGMIRHNVTAIVTALGGTLPDWPDELADWAARHGQ
ncbi:MAG: metal ABC transporter solute-binding protein, Zn/Mn family [Roseinatronobacter sp.]